MRANNRLGNNERIFIEDSTGRLIPAIYKGYGVRGGHLVLIPSTQKLITINTYVTKEEYRNRIVKSILDV